jgi:hypothetical protein
MVPPAVVRPPAGPSGAVIASRAVVERSSSRERATAWGRIGVGLAAMNIGCGTAPPSRTAPSIVERSTDVALPVAPPRLLATAVDHTCVQLAGDLRCWGLGDWGALGSDKLWSEEDPAPVRVVGESLYGLAAHGRRTCGVTQGGGVTCWGGHVHAGSNDTMTRLEPLHAIEGVGDATAVALGLRSGCALDAARRVSCWRMPNPEAHPPEDDLDHWEARRVESLPEVSRIAASEWGTCAVTVSAELWCWREPPPPCKHGHCLGDPAPACTPPACATQPARVMRGVDSVTPGEPTCALLASRDGARCWLPDGDVSFALPPSTETIAATTDRVCALGTDGDLRCGSLPKANGATCNTDAPCSIDLTSIARDIVDVVAAGGRGIALERDGRVWQWYDDDEPTPLRWRGRADIAAERRVEEEAFARQRAEATTLMEAAHLFIAASPTQRTRMEAIGEMAFALAETGPLDPVLQYRVDHQFAGIALAEALASAGRCDEANERMELAWRNGSLFSASVLERCPSPALLKGMSETLRAHGSDDPKHWWWVALGWHHLKESARRDAAIAQARLVVARGDGYPIRRFLPEPEIAALFRVVGAAQSGLEVVEPAARQLVDVDEKILALFDVGMALEQVGERERARAIAAELSGLGEDGAAAEALAAAAELALATGERSRARVWALRSERLGEQVGRRSPRLIAVWVELGDLARAHRATLANPEAGEPYFLAQARKGGVKALREARGAFFTMFTHPFDATMIEALVDDGHCEDALAMMSEHVRGGRGWVVLAERCPTTRPQVLEELRGAARDGFWFQLGLEPGFHVIDGLCLLGHCADALEAMTKTCCPEKRVGALVRLSQFLERRNQPLDPAARSALRSLVATASFPR